jgi:hypothetical protein
MGGMSSGPWAKLWHKNKKRRQSFFAVVGSGPQCKVLKQKTIFVELSSDTPHVVTATVRHWEYRDMGCWHIFLALNAETGFSNLKHEIIPLSVQKKY